MLEVIFLVSIYFCTGITIINIGHTVFSHFFHSKRKMFGIPLFGLSVELPTRFGFISSVLMFFISLPYIIGYMSIPIFLLENISGLPEILGLLIPIYVPLFILSQLVSGPSISKGILEFSLFVLTSSLIHISIIQDTNSDVTLLGTGFIFGLASIYITWLALYVYDKKLDPTLSKFFEQSDFGDSTDERLLLIATIVYFPLSSAYMIVGYWTVAFLLLNL